MRGEILTYDDIPGTGLISGDDGARYSFTRADLQQLVPVRAGTKVDFVPVDGTATQVFVTTTAPSAPLETAYTPGVAGSGARFDWRALFLDPAGRIGQKDFWIGFGILFLANMLFGWVPLIGQIVFFACLYAWVCVASKRLHDLGKSGWLAALPVGIVAAAMVLTIVTLTGGVLGAMAHDGGFSIIAGAGLVGVLWSLGSLINFVFVIWLGVAPGQPGDNRYGPPPRPLAEF
jgi:uncharacterized membrane protein YhaH (DUF805 family)